MCTFSMPEPQLQWLRRCQHFKVRFQQQNSDLDPEGNLSAWEEVRCCGHFTRICRSHPHLWSNSLFQPGTFYYSGLEVPCPPGRRCVSIIHHVIIIIIIIIIAHSFWGISYTFRFSLSSGIQRKCTSPIFCCCRWASEGLPVMSLHACRSILHWVWFGTLP